MAGPPVLLAATAAGPKGDYPDASNPLLDGGATLVCPKGLPLGTRCFLCRFVFTVEVVELLPNRTFQAATLVVTTVVTVRGAFIATT